MKSHVYFYTIWLPNFRKKTIFPLSTNTNLSYRMSRRVKLKLWMARRTFFHYFVIFPPFSFSLSLSPAQSVFLFPSSHSSWNWVTHVRISTSPPRKDEHGNVYDRTFFHSTLSKIKNLFSFVPNIEHSSMCKLKLTWKYHIVNLVVSLSIVFQFFKFRDCVRYNHFL